MTFISVNNYEAHLTYCADYLKMMKTKKSYVVGANHQTKTETSSSSTGFKKSCPGCDMEYKSKNYYETHLTYCNSYKKFLREERVS